LNVVVVILEGVQYRHTSLWDANDVLTPFLARFAREARSAAAVSKAA